MSLAELDRREKIGPSERVFLVENGQLPPKISNWIRTGLIENEDAKWREEDYWQQFIESAESIWVPFIPEKNCWRWNRRPPRNWKILNFNGVIWCLRISGEEKK